MGMTSRLHAAWRSYRALPLWVQIWVGLCLVPVNMVPFFMLDTATGRAGALAIAAVAATNMPILIYERGMSRLLSIPHLVAWIPLWAWLAHRLYSGVPMSGAESVLAWALLIVNGISLVFDVLDSARWLHGAREVAVAPATGSRH